MERRTFLKWVGHAGSALWLGPTLFGCGKCNGGEEQPPETAAATGPAEAPQPDLRFFDEHRRPIAEAMVDRLFPAAGDGPGGAELGVLGYIDGQLMLPEFQNQAELIKRGLVYLDATARREQGNKRFHELEPDVQDEILTRFQVGRLQGSRFPTDDFFETFNALLLEGVLGHPRHGGNRDKLAWRWLGVDPSCLHMHTACGE